MDYAWIENGVVANLIVLAAYNAAEFPNAVPIGEKPVMVGDSYAEGVFYRDGVPVRTPSEEKLIEQARTIETLAGGEISPAQAAPLRAQIEAAAALLPDEQAAAAAALFPLWSGEGGWYPAGARVRWGGLLYKCLTGHQPQADWEPGAAPSLWVRVDDPTEQWPAWRQPQGSHDAYPKGAQVSHNGRRWVSEVDANTWEPGVYGWVEQV